MDDQQFFAWLDGELSPTEAAAMETKVAADPQLARLAEQHRALRSRLSSAFDPIAEAPVPDNLLASLRPTTNVIDFAQAKRSRSIPALPQWTALAATLAIGVLVGTMIPPRSEAPVKVQDGKLYAASALNEALDKQLASAPAGAVHIGLTFRDHQGEVCRSFTGSGSTGLACRSGGRWQLRGLFAAPEGQANDYRMAAGMDPALASLVDSTMAGDPLDAAQERAAKSKGWR